VCAAVERCWASLDTERAVAYRRQQGVADEGLAMAVVVQRLVPADVAGVLFTRDPLDPDGRRMLVEASWGLGESVVSGQVSPDRYRVDPDTGRVVERQVARKRVRSAGGGATEPVPEELQHQPCLDDEQLAELAELGRRIEALYGGPRDVEWAWVRRPEGGGKFWLLQARPITAGAAEREQVRREEMAVLAARAEPAGTVWARFNLSEVLAEPTPMTWALVRRFMSGRGGFGLAFRDLGFDPDPSLDEEGIFDLVCGRPYCNLSRQARAYSQEIPFEYPFAALKADPARAFYPAATVNPARFPWHFWLLFPVKVPLLVFRLLRAAVGRQRIAATFAARYRDEIAPAFRREVAAGLAEDLSALGNDALLAGLGHWVRKTLDDFARDSLEATALALDSLGLLEQRLTPTLGAERARSAARELLMGVRPEPEADLVGAMAELAAGRLGWEAFLERFGHRGNQEMELSEPRWSEDSSALRRQVGGGGAGPAPPVGQGGAWERIADEAKLAPAKRAELKGELERLHVLVGLRETAKNDLMRGYALVRRLLLEVGRRGRLGGGVFYLLPEELPRLLAGEDLSATVAARRRRRALALSLEAPAVLYSDDLEALGRPVLMEGAEQLQGVPLSAGVAEGVALVLDRPEVEELPAERYILVCPSTDPAWVPLFGQARALVMESGGVLSHGAIVAREYGLPAVAGLPGVQRRLRTGQRVRVDGARGTVVVLP
jgi:pyruvate,water dikinase